MKRARATLLLSIFGVEDAGELIAHKRCKGFEIWVWENGVTKCQEFREFGWIPDYITKRDGWRKNRVATFYFALDNGISLRRYARLPPCRDRLAIARDLIAREVAIDNAARIRSTFHVVGD